MTTIFKFDSAEDVNESFFEAIKAIFKNNQINIIVNDEIDETEYLLKDEETKNKLLRRLENVRNGKVVDMNLEEPILT